MNITYPQYIKEADMQYGSSSFKAALSNYKKAKEQLITLWNSAGDLADKGLYEREIDKCDGQIIFCEMHLLVKKEGLGKLELTRSQLHVQWSNFFNSDPKLAPTYTNPRSKKRRKC